MTTNFRVPTRFVNPCPYRIYSAVLTRVLDSYSILVDLGLERLGGYLRVDDPALKSPLLPRIAEWVVGDTIRSMVVTPEHKQNCYM
jgi:hypothetical protein